MLKENEYNVVERFHCDDDFLSESNVVCSRHVLSDVEHFDVTDLSQASAITVDDLRTDLQIQQSREIRPLPKFGNPGLVDHF